MHISAEQVQKALLHLKDQIAQSTELLNQAFETHLNSVLDHADDHPDYEGTYGNQLHDLRLELDHHQQKVTSFYSELDSYGIGNSAILGAENESAEQMLHRMKHKADLLALFSALHNEIAQSSQKLALLHKKISELAQRVNQSKTQASLEELKRKMGLK